MTEPIKILNPIRWKVFQCLILEGENDGGNSVRDARDLTITSKQFKEFLTIHKSVPFLVPEDNETMKDSYLILDEKMRFLDCTTGGKKPSESILDVGVEIAIQKSGFDQSMFHKRGGVYSWAKSEFFSNQNQNLDW